MRGIMAKRKVVKKAKKSAGRKRGGAGTGVSAGGKLPKDAITLVVHMKSRDGQELLLEAELGALVAPTRKEEGCLLYELHRSADAPGAFLFYEIWASREAHAAHLRTDHFLRWSARKDALTAKRESSFWKKIL
jgi:quinol monooxygenase YgiN